ncbi:hypothetical protein JTB14_004275 [Gonioctena quinquepunctata]|nr:hypothetical protein JTB14_004275 [Gonioctena quinquepunctata]
MLGIAASLDFAQKALRHLGNAKRHTKKLGGWYRSQQEFPHISHQPTSTLIDPNYFSGPENHDINVLHEGFQLALKLVETEAFQKINAKFQARALPACKEFQPFSRDFWFCSLKYLSFDIFHPMGTCSMGPDPTKGADVNNKCKVHGFENLRVADTSVFPSTTSGNPVAVCVMIGVMVADSIKNANFSNNKSV